MFSKDEQVNEEIEEVLSQYSGENQAFAIDVLDIIKNAKSITAVEIIEKMRELYPEKKELKSRIKDIILNFKFVIRTPSPGEKEYKWDDYGTGEAFKPFSAMLSTHERIVQEIIHLMEHNNYEMNISILLRRVSERLELDRDRILHSIHQMLGGRHDFEYDEYTETLKYKPIQEKPEQSFQDWIDMFKKDKD